MSALTRVPKVEEICGGLPLDLTSLDIGRAIDSVYCPRSRLLYHPVSYTMVYKIMMIL